MSTAVDVARAGAADMISVNPSSPHAKKRAPARRGVVPSDEVDVAVDGTPAPTTAEAPAGKKRARSPDDSPVRPMRSLEDAREEPISVRARPADASPRHPAALHPATSEDAVRRLVSLAVSTVEGVVSAPRGERASISLDALRPRHPENIPAYLEVVHAFDTLRRELDFADADPGEEGEPGVAAANLDRTLRRDVPSNEPSEEADVADDGRLRPSERRFADESRAESERREAAARRERELARREARVLSRESELAVSSASVEKERAAAEATVRSARRETEEMRARLADAEKRAAAARDEVRAAERRLEEASNPRAKETTAEGKTGSLIDPRRALEFKRHLATYMKRLDGEAACLTSILESGGGFTATEALAALGEMCVDEPDGRAATHMVVVHQI